MDIINFSKISVFDTKTRQLELFCSDFYLRYAASYNN